MFAQSTCRGFALSKSISCSLLITQLARTTIISQTIRGTRNLPPPPRRQQSLVKAVWKKLFGKYLLATNIISSGVLMVVGDVAAQELEYHRGILRKRYDTARMWRMFVVGSLQGPLYHYTYGWMDRIMPAVTVRNTIKKILLDQFIVSPIYILLVFYPACYLESKTLRETNDEIIAKFPYVYIMDWCVGPPVQYINFQYLETKYRVIFVNVMNALYNVFISYIKHDET